MPKMKRFSSDHLAVSYNETDLPVYLNWISVSGDTLKSELGLKEVPSFRIGPVVGTHGGPGAVGGSACHQ